MYIFYQIQIKSNCKCLCNTIKSVSFEIWQPNDRDKITHGTGTRSFVMTSHIINKYKSSTRKFQNITKNGA